MSVLYNYVGTSEKLKNAVVTVDRETEKSYFVNFRPAGGGAGRNRKGFKIQPKAASIHGGDLT